jgi:hypothetical protein
VPTNVSNVMQMNARLSLLIPISSPLPAADRPGD